MKHVGWLIACPILLVLGVVSLFQAFRASTSFNFGYPLSTFNFEIAGKAYGGWVATAALLELLAVITLVVGVIAAFRSGRTSTAR